MHTASPVLSGSLLDLFRGFEDVRIHDDPRLGFTAIVAVHSTTLGPALGGCRRMSYSSLWGASVDVSRLAAGMTSKAALAALPLGGGKCVMIPWKQGKRMRRAQFRALGTFIESMNGTYISAEDVGTTVADVHAMAESTRHVAGDMQGHPYHGDPSRFTAEGVLAGMLGAVRALDGQSALLENRSVYVEGIGKVGFALLDLLHKEGVQLFVSNRMETEAERAALAFAVSRFRATVVELDSSGRPKVFPYVEIYAPCALGGVVSDESIRTYPFTLKLIAGSANNALLDAARDGDMLRRREILYAPDYVINNGGLRDIYHQLCYKRDGVAYDPALVLEGCRGNEKLLYDITSRALTEGKCPHVVADEMAEAIIKEKRYAGLQKAPIVAFT